MRAFWLIDRRRYDVEVRRAILEEALLRGRPLDNGHTEVGAEFDVAILLVEGIRRRPQNALRTAGRALVGRLEVGRALHAEAALHRLAPDLRAGIYHPDLVRKYCKFKCAFNHF